MKKWLIIVVVFCILSFAGIYILIPGTLIISKIETIKSAKNLVSRFLLDETMWHKWWPKQGRNTGLDSSSSFNYNGYTYHITELFTDKVNVFTTNGRDSVRTSIIVLPLDYNSITLQWEGRLEEAGLNPVERVLKYRQGVEIKKNMTSIFKALQEFLEKTSNVYGFPIEEIISKDSTLIATKYIAKTYPATKDIYDLIDTMKNYVVQKGAFETGYPMLRVSKMNDSMFQTMIAIPTNKAIDGNGRLFFLRFVPYKTITGTVRGGVYSIEQAFKQMEIFIDDHQRTSMAAPFQSLVTDRRMETDSLKWITVICQPVS